MLSLFKKEGEGDFRARNFLTSRLNVLNCSYFDVMTGLN